MGHESRRRVVLGGLRVVPDLLIVSGFCAFLWGLAFFVLGDALGQGVAVDAEDGGGLGDVLLVTGQGLLYVKLLKLLDRLIQKDVAFEHFIDQAFETVVNQSSFPVSSRYASR